MTQHISKQTYVIDVPEAKNFSGRFHYNFFTKDESTSENAIIPKAVIEKQSEYDTTKFFTFVETKMPRFIQLNWSTPAGLFTNTTVDKQRNINLNQHIISQNIDKILTEDSVASGDFVGFSFKNFEIDQELYLQLSGTNIKTLDQSISYITSLNTKFDTGILKDTQSFDNTQNVTIGSQINTKYVTQIMNASKFGASSLSYIDYNNAAKLFAQYAKNTTYDPRINDYKNTIPYIDMISIGSLPVENTSFDLVGYIIDKAEILDDGTIIDKNPLIIETKHINQTLDYNVKYGSRYLYQVRSIYKLYVPAIDVETGISTMLVVLVSSKPSNKSLIVCVERKAPPPPCDIEFVWDYLKKNNRLDRPGRLLLYWAFPTNSQRDIKYFQILRRRSIRDPFEVIKIFDFNDAIIKPEFVEEYTQEIIQTSTNPILYWFDDEFIKSSRFIYALASIDAHGYISNYSTQFEVWFDTFNNKLQKRLVSHSGAPRPYPNLYIENDLFIDVIKATGEKSKKIEIFFTPEYYNVLSKNGEATKIVSSKQRNTEYKLHIINTDNQKDQTVTVELDDPKGVMNTTFNKDVGVDLLQWWSG